MEAIKARSKPREQQEPPQPVEAAFSIIYIVLRRSKMDHNDANKKPKLKTEDFFPGASTAWSNAWYFDAYSLTTQEEEGHTDYQEHDEPDAGWEPLTS